LYSTFSIKKAVYAELAVKHVKSKLYKHMSQKKNKNWINVLAQVTKSINDSYNTSIGMSPSHVTEADQSVIWNRIYRKVIENSPKKHKFKIGDRVRIGKTKIELGKKGFESNWTEEVFRVSQIINTVPVPSYRLEDLNQEQLQGSYLEPELNRIP
jgi:hypothetical protein